MPEPRIVEIQDITTLYSASEAKATAQTAIEEIDNQAAAKLINYTSNTGETCAVWQRPMTDELRKTLEGANYKVRQIVRCANPGRLFTISWK